MNQTPRSKLVSTPTWPKSKNPKERIEAGRRAGGIWMSGHKPRDIYVESDWIPTLGWFGKHRIQETLELSTRSGNRDRAGWLSHWTLVAPLPDDLNHLRWHHTVSCSPFPIYIQNHITPTSIRGFSQFFFSQFFILFLFPLFLSFSWISKWL